MRRVHWWRSVASKLTWAGGSVLLKNLAGANDKAVFYLSKATALYSLKSEGYARTKAVWTDRSSNARGGLTGTYDVSLGADTSSYTINVFHKMNYGIWLELRFNQKYAIIKKTVDAQGPKFFQMSNDIFNRMFDGKG